MQSKPGRTGNNKVVNVRYAYDTSSIPLLCSFSHLIWSNFNLNGPSTHQVNDSDT